MPPKASKNRKAANGYRLPDPLPEGEIITGLAKTSWRLGKSIGVGGFGEIYLCSPNTSRPVGEDAGLAMKIEPHENGPLFVEMNFYIRAAQERDVEEFKKGRRMSQLGMPVHRGSGSHKFNGDRYRFLVMDRYGRDLEHMFQSGQRPFSVQTAFNLSNKIIDVLEYIHSRGYVHNDIKAQNLLLGYGRAHENDIYLVDFGLVSKYQREGVHLEYKPDARKAHDGTIEYTSRDAHIGAHSRRSDLEILGYNLVHWMSGTLPWMDNLTNAEYVHALKKRSLGDISAFLETCFGENEYPSELEEFLQYVISLEFDTIPDYQHCQALFNQGLKKRKYPLNGKIDFTATKSPVKKGRKGRKGRVKGKRNGVRNQSPSSLDELLGVETGAVTRSGESVKLNDWSWEKILCSDPEMLIRRASRHSETDDQNPLTIQLKVLDDKRQAESLENPTPAMLAILGKIETRELEREQMSWHQQLHHLTGRKSNIQRNSSVVWDLTPNPLTPAMEEVIAMRSKRISVDYDIPITPEPSDDDDANPSGEESGEEDWDNSSDDEEYQPRPLAGKKKVGSVTNGLKRQPSRRCSPVRKCSLNPPVSGARHEESRSGLWRVSNGGDQVDAKSLKSILKEDINLAKQREAFKKFEMAKKKVTKELSECSMNMGGSYSENTATPSKESKGPRRISIQNEAELIRNKNSPPDEVDRPGSVLNGDAHLERLSGSKGSSKAKKSKERWFLHAYPSLKVVNGGTRGRPRSPGEDELNGDHLAEPEITNGDCEVEEDDLPLKKPSPRKTRAKSKDVLSPSSKSSARRNLAKTAFGSDSEPPSRTQSRKSSKRSSPVPEVDPPVKEESMPVDLILDDGDDEIHIKSSCSKRLAPSEDENVAQRSGCSPPSKKSRQVSFTLGSPSNDDLFGQLLMSGVKNKIFQPSAFPSPDSKSTNEPVRDQDEDSVSTCTHSPGDTPQSRTPEPKAHADGVGKKSRAKRKLNLEESTEVPDPPLKGPKRTKTKHNNVLKTIQESSSLMSERASTRSEPKPSRRGRTKSALTKAKSSQAKGSSQTAFESLRPTRSTRSSQLVEAVEIGSKRRK